MTKINVTFSVPKNNCNGCFYLDSEDLPFCNIFRAPVKELEDPSDTFESVPLRLEECIAAEVKE